MAKQSDAPITSVAVSAYRIPTAAPESDGTMEWDATTLVLVTVEAASKTGLGYSYADRGAAVVVHDLLAEVLQGRDAFDIPGCWAAMVQRVRNIGRPGSASMAISACDAALHDLKAKLLDVPLARLLGQSHDSVALYGSGGFTSMSETELCEQLTGWAEEGFKAVKMKIGREPEQDEERVKLARHAIGKDVALFVDANGAYSRKQALGMAESFAKLGVTWFEEPVSSNDLDGLRLLRDRAPAGIDITAGEYGYDSGYFRRMLAAGAVDVLQADATRCAGITGFMKADALTDAFEVPLSSHTAPNLHLACCCAAHRVQNMEWFFDHVRIENMLFDGAVQPQDGRLAPNLDRPGLGVDFKQSDAERFLVS
ncbi:MAG TPA: enolase C-terminal domain-like protein [Devosia sp.]|nr:enolase C-terminal domain-like protein [Devosia sp.]